MIKAEYTDKTLIVDILTKSFETNQSVNYLVKQDKHRIRRIKALMEYSFNVCYSFGDVFLSNDRKACALILYPDKKKMTIMSIWFDLKLIFQAIGIAGIGKTIKREALIKNMQPTTNMAYLWFIGVNPLYQHIGTGSKLLNEVIVNSIQKGLPIYLETSTLRNLPWYQRFDFQVYGQITLTYTLYFLKRAF